MRRRPILRRLQPGLLGLAAACFLAGAAVTVADVLLRRLAGANVPGAIELTSFLIGFGALVSMPVCYARRCHVTAKLLSEMAPNRFALPLGRLGALASLGFAGLMLWSVGSNAWEKIGSPETSRDLGLPMPLLLGAVSLILAAAVLGALVGLRRHARGSEV
ncbi:TRAP transporter small permease [Xinfangfangia pollutisoli]|uniref:TRAP transporter small permease n=1 Tax=Xinfangfangia pollutisoli TaxID=2865960 RepID=UPI001CD6A174|nr:TRAP transporter small permease subunit [Xinfangfangia pollutisoli]